MSLCGDDHKKLIDRLNRIDGQVKGIIKMVEDDRSCFDVLKQIAAVNGAVKSIGMVVLENHLKGCVSEAIRDKENSEKLIDEVIDLFSKFNK
jgi:DNA-binding FrmR family transcriptional regulator